MSLYRAENVVRPSPATSPPTGSPERDVLPHHVGVILDGNRRWARDHHTDYATAYRRGGERVHQLLAWCQETGIEVVTLWPLSTDNLGRDGGELRALLTVIVDVLRELAEAGRWRLRLIGDLARLPPVVRDSAVLAQHRTASVRGPLVNIAMAYDGHQDITTAVRAVLAEQAGLGTSLDVLADTLSRDQIAAALSTAGLPDVDLIIRTSGEQRLSGFLSWQSAYSELHFCSVNWPDFEKRHFREALDHYRDRERRFGV